MKYFKQTLATYMYSHCNMCNIPIYFCNIYMKQLQHTSETSETLDTHFCNMCFQLNISSLLGRMEAHWHADFTGVELVGGAKLAAPVEKGAPVEKSTADLTRGARCSDGTSCHCSGEEGSLRA